MRLSLGLGRDNTRIFWAMIFNEGGFGIYQTLWPIYIAALGASPRQIGLVIGIAGFARLFFLLPSGMIGDRMSPGRLIAGGRALSVAGLVLIGAAREWWHLFPGVILMAAGTIAFPAISNAIAESAGEGRERTRAFTLIYTVGPSAAYLVTPALGGLIADRLGLRVIFFAGALLTATAAAIFSTLAVRISSSSEGATASYRSALRERPILRLLLLMLATIFILMAGLTLAPNFLQDVHGISIERIGWLGSAAAIGSATLGLVISRVALFQQPIAGIALAIASVAGTFALLLAGDSLWVFAVAYLLRGGFMTAWAAFFAALGDVTPDWLRGRVFALAELLAGAGMALAPFVAGWLYAADPAAPLVASLAVIGPLLLATGWVARKNRSVAAPAPALAEERV